MHYFVSSRVVISSRNCGAHPREAFETSLTEHESHVDQHRSCVRRQLVKIRH
jgi:hypothetical protein